MSANNNGGTGGSSTSTTSSSSSCHGFSKTIATILSSKPRFATMLDTVNSRLRRFCSRLRWSVRGQSKTKNVIRRKSNKEPETAREASIRINDRLAVPDTAPAIRLATFNAAMFSMAPAVPGGGSGRLSPAVELDIRGKSANDRPKGILKQRSYGKSKMRVSINLPDNEISLERMKQSNSGRLDRGKAPMFPSLTFSSGRRSTEREAAEMFKNNRSIMDVLREMGADIVALQNVKAEEEKGMKPLSELAEALGMKYVFAESWAPEYGDAILSKWPIKRWRVQKIFDDSDYRNVIKATIDVPRAGEVNFHCTHLDHLDEKWRMKQIGKILQSSDGPHILAGGLNSLDETDYSEERWSDIVKYYEEIGKPTPKVEVMKFLREKQYLDAKNFAGECESVVVVAKGQDVQGTCKYGTRVDYILASPNSPYKFVPGSYMVISSKGTSDHHIVKVDIKTADMTNKNNARFQKSKPKVVKIDKATSKGIWSTKS